MCVCVCVIKECVRFVDHRENIFVPIAHIYFGASDGPYSQKRERISSGRSVDSAVVREAEILKGS
jgi:hypothetical protein